MIYYSVHSIVSRRLIFYECNAHEEQYKPRENKESWNDYFATCKFEKTMNQVSGYEYELSSPEYGIVISIYVVWRL